MDRVSPAREVATGVLLRVFRDGAFAATVLNRALGTGELEARDRALATELVFGTLRRQVALAEAIRRHLPRPGAKVNPLAWVSLLMAAYQLFHLERVPRHAAVSEAVHVVRRARGARLAGFVNAVLRKLDGDGSQVDPRVRATVALPPWLEAKLRESLRPDHAEAVLRGGAVPPPNGLRVRGSVDRDGIVARIRHERPGATVRPGALTDRAVVVSGAGEARTLGVCLSGEARLQEQGSQVVAEAVGARGGERVLDACSGRGGKALVLCEAVGPTGQVVAADYYEEKLDVLREEWVHFGAFGREPERCAVDWTVGPGELGERAFDRVLVDAPCSGTGTLHRRPEILLRLNGTDLDDLQRLQGTILSEASKRVRPGGVLVYAVCSLLHGEGEQVVRAFVDGPAGTEFVRGAPVRTLGPWADGCDGYQIFTLGRAPWPRQAEV